MTAIQRFENGNGMTLTQSLQDTLKLGDVFAKSGYFQDARDAAQCVVKIIQGAELGLGPMASMNGIYIVKGRPTIGAHIMAALVKRSGRYNYRVTEQTDRVVAITFYELFNGQWQEIGESRFTIEDAKRAGTQNTERFPRNMLFARAMSNGVRWHCPDVTAGPLYTPEEMEEATEAEAEPPTKVDFLPAESVVPEVLATDEMRAEIKQLLAEVYANEDDQKAYIVTRLGRKPFKQLSSDEYWDLSAKLREILQPSMEPTGAGVLGDEAPEPVADSSQAIAALKG